jgi:cell division protein FtsB
VQAVLPPALFLSLVGYFLWNASQGDRGWRAYEARMRQFETVQKERDQVDAERRVWERRVAALRSERLDPDMLDERARAMLNLAEPSDIVVPLRSPGTAHH